MLAKSGWFRARWLKFCYTRAVDPSMDKAWWRKEKTAPVEELGQFPNVTNMARELHYQQARELGLPQKVAELQSYALYPFDEAFEPCTALHDAYPHMKSRFVGATEDAGPDRIGSLAQATVREYLHIAYTNGDMHYTATLAAALDRNRPRRRPATAEERFGVGRARFEEPSGRVDSLASDEAPSGETAPAEPVDQFESLRAALTTGD